MHCIIPTLELHNGTGALIASNDNWVRTIIGGIITQSQVRDIMNSGYAPSNGLESAIIADLPPGNYTAIVRGVNDTTGVGLVEVYDLNILVLFLLRVLRNISSRSVVLTGDNVMIGGFIVQGGTKRVSFAPLALSSLDTAFKTYCPIRPWNCTTAEVL